MQRTVLIGALPIAASVSSLLLGSPPIPRTQLIVREIEQGLARHLLLVEAVPLLTLTGPGGFGKTWLVQTITDDVAEHFADGMVFRRPD